MNKTLTSKDAILASSKVIVIETGLQSLNMRDVAKKCNVAVGSVYNYYPSKSELIIATIESIWKEIMHCSHEDDSSCNFIQNVELIFNNILVGCKKYPSFFTAHSMSIINLDTKKGREVMDNYFVYIKTGLINSLLKDQNVKKDAFSKDFTQKDLVDFVFSNILSLILSQKTSCNFLLEITKRAIYEYN